MENTEEKTVNENPGTANPQDDKVIGILSYLGILWIVAYILYGNKKSDYNLFHVRQGLGLFIISIAAYIIGYVPFIGWLIYYVVAIFVLVCAIMGIIAAANGTKKEVPLIGKTINDMLQNIK